MDLQTSSLSYVCVTKQKNIAPSYPCHSSKPPPYSWVRAYAYVWQTSYYIAVVPQNVCPTDSCYMLPPDKVKRTLKNKNTISEAGVLASLRSSSAYSSSSVSLPLAARLASETQWTKRVDTNSLLYWFSKEKTRGIPKEDRVELLSNTDRRACKGLGLGQAGVFSWCGFCSIQ